MSDTETVEGRFDLGDVLKIPSPKITQFTKILEAAGRKWRIVIDDRAAASAEGFYMAATAMSSAQDEVPKEITLPLGGVLTVRDPLYLGNIAILASCAVEPQLSVSEWCIFGSRIGREPMQDLLRWVVEHAGIASADWMEDAMSAAKNGHGAADSREK